MKYLYIFFIALTSFVYGQYTPNTSSLFNDGAAAYPRNITAAYATDGNTGQAQTLSFNVTSLPDGDPKFRFIKLPQMEVTILVHLRQLICVKIRSLSRRFRLVIE